MKKKCGLLILSNFLEQFFLNYRLFIKLIFNKNYLNLEIKKNRSSTKSSKTKNSSIKTTLENHILIDLLNEEMLF